MVAVHLVIDQVRKALRGKVDDGFRMGTVLSLVENAMFRQLWARDFHVVSCAASWEEGPARESHS